MEEFSMKNQIKLLVIVFVVQGFTSILASSSDNTSSAGDLLSEPSGIFTASNESVASSSDNNLKLQEEALEQQLLKATKPDEQHLLGRQLMRVRKMQEDLDAAHQTTV
jgi:hypothetical protein